MPQAGTGTGTGGTGAPQAGSGGAPAVTGGSSGAPAMTGGSGGAPVVGTGGSTPGGNGPTAGSGGGGGTGPIGPYDARSGPFKMLVLTRTAGYRHDGSINTGRAMLEQIAQEQGNIELTFVGTVIPPGATKPDDDLSDADLDAAITAENLAQYEIIFHLNTTGGIFDDAQKQIYEDWMTRNGAFAGVHSATDTENNWDFYAEVTGQYYNGHGNVTGDQIALESSMLNHPALKGVPNPWQRNEEWYKFDQWQAWSAKPGFQILGKKNADSQPIMWLREWGNFRAFYTALGHDAVVFEDPVVKKHVTGGLMWAVRREHLIK